MNKVNRPGETSFNHNLWGFLMEFYEQSYSNYKSYK